MTKNSNFYKIDTEVDGVWWPSRSSKPLFAQFAWAGSIPASSVLYRMNKFAQIPQLEKLLSEKILVDLAAKIGRANILPVADEYLQNIRTQLKAGTLDSVPSLQACATAVEKACAPIIRSLITNVVNASGVILHTNLGRSPLPKGVWNEAEKIASEYSSIEFDLTGGKRGSRFAFLTHSLSQLLGTEASLIVNNNAAAVFLLLKALAEGGEVIVSRGQQVQIGGGFRIPEILKAAGCTLVEVGTTNITTLDDIRNAINENTKMVLAVHSSNYRIRGFTQFPALRDIKKALPEHIIFAVDQGSGNIDVHIDEEVTVREIIKSGADLVCFSGDKIFGGPQAGWISGKKALVDKIARHQLMRTYRVGRAVASLMQACLVRYLNGEKSVAAQALNQDPENIKARCEKIAAQLAGKKNLDITVVEAGFSLGGGSTPDISFPTYALKLIGKKSPDRIKNHLRDLARPIIVIVENDTVLLHLVSVSEADDAYLVQALQETDF